jgi:hypothetical protein
MPPVQHLRHLRLVCLSTARRLVPSRRRSRAAGGHRTGWCRRFATQALRCAYRDVRTCMCIYVWTYVDLHEHAPSCEVTRDRCGPPGPDRGPRRRSALAPVSATAVKFVVGRCSVSDVCYALQLVHARVAFSPVPRRGRRRDSTVPAPVRRPAFSFSRSAPVSLPQEQNSLNSDE